MAFRLLSALLLIAAAVLALPAVSAGPPPVPDLQDPMGCHSIAGDSLGPFGVRVEYCLGDSSSGCGVVVLVTAAGQNAGPHMFC